MMYGGDAQHQQRQPPQGQQPPPHLQPPLPPGPPPPYAQLQQQQPPPGMEFQRGPPPQMQMNRQPSAPSTANFPHHPPPYEAHADSYAAKRMRKLTQRRAVDYTSTIVRYIQARMWQRDSRDRTSLQPIPAAVVDLLPAAAYSDNPSTSFAAKFVHTSINKVRCPIYRVLWTPNGRRLITGSQSGEFTLWNGQSFNFEMIIQAHDNAISSMVWSHNGNWMVSGDNGGSIKYWQTNMNNVKVNKSAHKESIRDLSFCRTDLKFCSCSDDTTVKVWDFAKCQEESSLTGHGWDVKCVDWHPSKSLLVSGGKDNLVKLWDAKSGKELCSFHGHKNTVLSAKWNDNGNWVLTASKDQVIKLYDIRAMKELESFRGHCKDVTALAWHPFHEDYFVSGSFDGSIFHWIVGHETPQIEMPSAHETAVWDLSWHPVGYLLCSGSNDHTTKFWCRNRPGDINRDKFNGGYNQGYGEQNSAFANRIAMNFPMPDGPTTPGSFPPGLARNEGTIPGVGAAMPLNFSSLDTSSEQKQGSMPLGAPPLPPGPHPSLLAAGQNPVYQQNSQQIPQQSVPQQMPPFPMPPHNMQQLQPPSHMNVLQNPHLPRPLQQMPPHGMPGSMGGQPSMQSLPPMPGTMGGPNQMGPPQGHYMGASSGGGFPNGMSNMQSNSGGAMYPPHGGYNRPQAGQMPMMPGLNPYQQPGNPNAMPQPPLPPGPPPQQTQQ